MYEVDQNRLLFLWFEDVRKDNFSLVAYRNKRLSFGLRCSPTILMLGLYKMLILDESPNDEMRDFKRSVYNKMYMDNGAISSSNTNELFKSYENLVEVFSKYKFDLQQFYTNCSELQARIDGTDSDEAPEVVKLFGMEWNRKLDVLQPPKIELDLNANTKRLVLRSLNSVYDVYNIYGPILLRSRLFVQKLQSSKDLKWDENLSEDLVKEWHNIVRQANSTPKVQIPRFIGSYDCKYSLFAYTDASKDAIGIVIYILNEKTRDIHFLMAKNRLISAQCRRTIPSLELWAIEFGVRTLIDLFESLTGRDIVCPINIGGLQLMTDSLVCLQWLQSYSIYFDKTQKLSVFVRNRLKNIDDLCRNKSVMFRHVAGEGNPADFLTRPCSFKILSKSNYYAGLQYKSLFDCETALQIEIPNKKHKLVDEDPEKISISNNVCTSPVMDNPSEFSHLVPLERYSSFKFHLGVITNVLKFIIKLKSKVSGSNEELNDINVRNLAWNKIISIEQQIHFHSIFDFFRSGSNKLKNVPDLVKKFNLYVDDDNVVRVRSKFQLCKQLNPILLPNRSKLTENIVMEMHLTIGHRGVYAILKELRRKFFLPYAFSVIKRVLKKCTICRRINNRPIKTNQSNYRHFRINPTKRAFS